MKMRKRKEYAVYKGDECLAIGTKKELAAFFSVTEKTVGFWLTPTNMKRERGGKRKIAVVLDD